MNTASALQTIAVGGEAVHARLVALILAEALKPHGCSVSLTGRHDDGWVSRTVTLGPTTHRMLHDLGLPAERLLQAGAIQSFGWAVRGITIPISPFGIPRGGADFHHHLQRVDGELSCDAMLAYNPAFYLAEQLAKSGPIAQPPIPFGLILERATFLRLLDDVIQAYGIAEGAENPDLTFTILGDGSAEWAGDEITVPTTGAFPELGLFRCVKAAQRFLSLMAGREDAFPLRREFNRLSQAEDERIADFAAFLVDDFTRPAVARKLEVFTACGRIPVEDYEVLPSHYWLTVLLQTGVQPRDYDRLADRFSLHDTQSWLLKLRTQMAQAAQQL